MRSSGTRASTSSADAAITAGPVDRIAAEQGASAGSISLSILIEIVETMPKIQFCGNP
jgi:hypothetical protein